MKLQYPDNLKRFFSLSYILARSEFKTKNTSIYTGVCWQLLNSIALAVILWLVFSRQLGNDINNYPAYLLIGIIIFYFFQRTTNEATSKFIELGAVIKSIKFSYRAIIFSIILESLFSHIIEMLILSALFIFILKINFIGLLFYPIILFLLVIFIYSWSLILATLTTLMIDIGHFWRFISPLLLFITPIFYSIENQPFLLTLNLFNPLYYFVTLTREIVLYQQPSIEMIMGVVIISIATFIISNLLFKKFWFRLVEKI